MHGAGGGGPSGRANGNYRHGGRTKRVADLVRYINALAECQLNGFANCRAVERVWVGYGFRQGR